MEMETEHLTAIETQTDLATYCKQTAERAGQAARELGSLSTKVKNDWLLAGADALTSSTHRILEANVLDLEAAPTFGLTPAAMDRLRLDAGRIESIAAAMREIAAFPDPVGETIQGEIRPSGIELRKVRVPLGTVFFIYESRPNVTVDAAAICVKSGNAVILRGGKEARHSSRVFVDILGEVAADQAMPPDAVQLVETTDRKAVGHFLQMSDHIDVVIPRGGRGLIERVSREASMPVIKHFDGNCHVYIDADADPKMAIDIVVNSKCQRMGVCNACESVVIHRNVAESLLPKLALALSKYDVEIRGDAATCSVLSSAAEATEDDWAAEYLGPTLSVRVVDSLDGAIEHINTFGSHHTDAIVTKNLENARRFQARVDSSAVMVNCSTRFNDGGEFGLGAEIGISTDKFHARGPCGLKELTTYKYLVTGSGQCR